MSDTDRLIALREDIWSKYLSSRRRIRNYGTQRGGVVEQAVLSELMLNDYARGLDHEITDEEADNFLEELFERAQDALIAEHERSIMMEG